MVTSQGRGQETGAGTGRSDCSVTGPRDRSDLRTSVVLHQEDSSGLGSTELHSWIEQTTCWLQELLSCFILQLNKAQRGWGGGTPPLNTTRLRLVKLVPSCLLSFTYLLTPLSGRCESMPSAAPLLCGSCRNVDGGVGEGKPSMPKSIPPLLGRLERSVIPFYSFYSFCLPFLTVTGTRRSRSEPWPAAP